MYLTGFADEAARDLDGQILATKTLGWNAIEARNVGGQNLHDLTQADFDRTHEVLSREEVYVNCFGSTIGNWAKQVDDPFEITLAEVERAIPRMHALGTKLIRIMSYARCEGEEQFKEERFRRLREIVARFLDAGLQPVHENCMNYGGMSALHSLELVENVPGLKLVFDTGNPPFNRDYSNSSLPWQNAWEFYRQIREHVVYIHIKDTLSPVGSDAETYTMPGQGEGQVERILRDLKERGYDGGISIEPHLAAVFHNPGAQNTAQDQSYELYVEYGMQLMQILESLGYKRSMYSVADGAQVDVTNPYRD